MFNEIYKKIKMLAKVITIVGVIASCILGLFFIVVDDEFRLVGVLILIGGSLMSWVSSFVLYGFGEVIELLTDIRNKTK